MAQNEQKASESEHKRKELSLDMFGHVNVNEKELAIEENLPLKPFRVKCFKVTVNLLEKIGVPYFITDGTLLSVWRDNGVLIPHDTDTDLGIMEEHMYKVWSNRHILPEGYGLDSRSKVTGKEWPIEKGIKFDPSGSQGLVMKMKVYDKSDPGPLKYCCGPWCSTDIFTFRVAEEDENLLARNYLAGGQGIGQKRYHKEDIFPLKRFKFEGIDCWGPNNPEQVLKVEYGYLGRDCYYDKEENIYKKIE